MQVVKYGKKQRIVKVPTDWGFIKDGVKIDSGDKIFNTQNHCWDDVKEGDFTKVVGKDDVIVIRKYFKASNGEIDKDTRAVRIVS